MTAPRSLTVTGSVELQLDRLAEAIAQRTAVLVVGMLRAAPIGPGSGTGTDIYERTGELPSPRTANSDPGGFPVGRDHPHSPDNPEETLS